MLGISHSCATVFFCAGGGGIGSQKEAIGILRNGPNPRVIQPPRHLTPSGKMAQPPAKNACEYPRLNLHLDPAESKVLPGGALRLTIQGPSGAPKLLPEGQKVADQMASQIGGRGWLGGAVKPEGPSHTKEWCQHFVRAILKVRVGPLLHC